VQSPAQLAGLFVCPLFVGMRNFAGAVPIFPKVVMASQRDEQVIIRTSR